MKRASDRARLFAVLEHLGFPKVDERVSVQATGDNVKIRIQWMPDVEIALHLSRAKFDEWMREALGTPAGTLRDLMSRASVEGALLRTMAGTNASPFDN